MNTPSRGVPTEEPPHTREPAGPIEVRAYPSTDWPRLAPTWARLAAEKPDSSFFLGERWTDSWMEVFGPLLEPQIVVFRHGGEPIGICLIVERRHRYGPVPVTRLYLNAAGEAESDGTYIEYNDLVCRPGWEGRVAGCLARYLGGRSWDELVLAGFSPGVGLNSLQDAIGRYGCQVSVRPSYYVDLEDLRRRGLSYEQALSSNTRRQIRRSIDLYQSEGHAVTLECARGMEEALEMLGQLADLHQRSWKARGKPGVFDSKYFSAFHRRLIESGLPRGEIHLLRISRPGKVIGVLYNFLHRGKVYFYQSGFDYAEDNRLKPGLVSHALAVQFCIERGYREYDFLAGDSQYKRSLATRERPLEWVVLERGTLAMRTVRLLRRVKSSYERISSKERTTSGPPRGPSREVPN